MSSFIKSFILFEIIFAATQLGAAQTTLDSPNQDDIDSAQVDPLKLNTPVFRHIKDQFGNVGAAFNKVMTNSEALGKEFSEISSQITDAIGFDNYRKSVDSIVDLLGQIDFQNRFSPLLDRLGDVRDPKTNESLGQAMEIFKNVFNDHIAFQELMKQIGNDQQMDS